jgi:hypothetical protein
MMTAYQHLNKHDCGVEKVFLMMDVLAGLVGFGQLIVHRLDHGLRYIDSV